MKSPQIKNQPKILISGNFCSSQDLRSKTLVSWDSPAKAVKLLQVKVIVNYSIASEFK